MTYRWYTISSNISLDQDIKSRILLVGEDRSTFHFTLSRTSSRSTFCYAKRKENKRESKMFRYEQFHFPPRQFHYPPESRAFVTMFSIFVWNQWRSQYTLICGLEQPFSQSYFEVLYKVAKSRKRGDGETNNSCRIKQKRINF